MKSRRRLSEGSNLCVIVDEDICAGRSLNITNAAVAAGAEMVQLRGKKSSTNDLIKIAGEMKKMTSRAGAIFIVNDRIDIAAASGADGVHLGQGDMPVHTARRILGSGKLIGVSVTDLKQARDAKKAGADYLGAGPVFATPMKAKKAAGIRLLEKIKTLKIPVFAIGGIDRKNAKLLRERGFKNIAVIRAVCCAKDPAQAVKDLRKAII